MANKAFLDASNGLTALDAVGAPYGAGYEQCVATTFTLSAELKTTTGFVPLVVIPAGAVLTDLEITHPDLDTGTPALLVDIGSAGDPDDIYDGSTAMQSAGTITLPAASKLRRFDEATVIGLTVATDADTGVSSGTIKTIARFIYDPQ